MQGAEGTSDPYKQSLFGSQPNCLNLSAILSKAEDLQRSIAEVTMALQRGALGVTWADVLKKFAVISVLYQSLRDQLRSLLKHFVVHPKMIDNAELAAVLPHMLATKLLPEMDVEQAELKAEHMPAVTATEVKFEQLTEAVDRLNSLLDKLFGPDGALQPPRSEKMMQEARKEVLMRKKEGKEPLPEKVPLLEEVQAMSRTVSATIQAQRSKRMEIPTGPRRRGARGQEEPMTALESTLARIVHQDFVPQGV